MPDGVVLLHRVGTELFAPYALTLLSPEAKELWTASIGLGRVEQVLPGEKVILIKGERPPVQNKVPEPLLVSVDVATGAIQAVSLWR